MFWVTYLVLSLSLTWIHTSAHGAEKCELKLQFSHSIPPVVTRSQLVEALAQKKIARFHLGSGGEGWVTAVAKRTPHGPVFVSEKEFISGRDVRKNLDALKILRSLREQGLLVGLEVIRPLSRRKNTVVFEWVEGKDLQTMLHDENHSAVDKQTILTNWRNVLDSTARALGNHGWSARTVDQSLHTLLNIMMDIPHLEFRTDKMDLDDQSKPFDALREFRLEPSNVILDASGRFVIIDPI